MVFVPLLVSILRVGRIAKRHFINLSTSFVAKQIRHNCILMLTNFKNVYIIMFGK